MTRSTRLKTLLFSFARFPASGPGIALLLVAAFLMVRIPFISQYPVNWDSVQYLLGVDSFDMQRHQPHPPGYIGYILLGHLFGFLFGDPHRGFVMLSVFSGAIATAAMFGLARCWFDRRLALIVAVLFGTSPLVWYYSGVALNYMVEAALVIPFAWFCFRAREKTRWRDLVMATLLLALLGAIRQSGFVLLVPLWLYTIWGFPWRQRVAGVTILGVSTLTWLMPLLWLAGGPLTYWRESRALGSLVSGQSTLMDNLQERAGYLIHLSLALTIGIMAALALLLIGWRVTSEIIRDLPRHDRWFFVLWAAPSLATFVIGHMGQFGYVLTVLPIAFLWIGAILARLPQPTAEWRVATPVLLTSLIVVLNTLMFATAPGGANVIARAIGGEESSASLHIRQYDIRTSDAYWDDLISSVRLFPADSTAVLTTIGGPRISGGYRHLSYYLPEYRVYGLGHDRHGAFGHVFVTREGESDYSVARLGQVERVIVLPENIRYVVTAEDVIIGKVDESLNATRVNGTNLVFIRRPPGMNLAFLPGSQIVACECSDLDPAIQAADRDRGG